VTEEAGSLAGEAAIVAIDTGKARIQVSRLKSGTS